MSSLTRANSIRLLCLIVVALLALLAPVLGRLATAAPAMTIRSAVIEVGTETMTIDVVVNARHTPYVNGPIKVEVRLPARTAGAVVSTDGGYNDLGWSIKFTKGASAGVGSVTVTIPGRNPRVQTEVGLAGESGWAMAVPGTLNSPAAIRFYV